MKVKLRVLNGNYAGKDVAVRKRTFYFGQSPRCQIQSKSPLMDRRHCALIVDKRLLIRDFDSKHGTFVNGERIKEDRVLDTGDELQIGPLKFEILIDHGLGGLKRSRVKSVSEAVTRLAGSAEKPQDVREFLQEDSQDNLGDWILPDDAPEEQPIQAPVSKRPSKPVKKESTGEAPEDLEKQDIVSSSVSAAAEALRAMQGS